MEETRGRPSDTTEEQRAEIVTAYLTGDYTQNNLAEMYGLDQPHISYILNKYALNEHGEPIEYIDESDIREELIF